MNQIVENQNIDKNILLLKARKQLYAVATKYYFADFLITAPLIIICGIFASTFPRFQVWYSFISLLVIFVSLFLRKKSSDFKLIGAKVQSKFDSQVLDIHTNDFLLGESVSYEIIKCNADKVSDEETKDLFNWYPKASSDLPITYGRIICQRANCYWSFSQRNFLLNVLACIAVVSFIIIIAIGIIISTTINDILLFILLPVIPVIQWSSNEISQQLESIKGLKDLKIGFDKLFDDILKKRISESDVDLISTQIQDAIFVRRSRDNVMPDFVYKLLRKGYESDMQFSATSLVSDIKEKL